MSVPKSLQPAFDGIEPMITDFCNQYLNDEYRELCLHLLEKLCRKRPSPLLAGRKNIRFTGRRPFSRFMALPSMQRWLG